MEIDDLNSFTWHQKIHTICCGYYSIDTQDRFSYTHFAQEEILSSSEETEKYS